MIQSFCALNNHSKFFSRCCLKSFTFFVTSTMPLMLIISGFFHVSAICTRATHMTAINIRETAWALRRTIARCFLIIRLKRSRKVPENGFSRVSGPCDDDGIFYIDFKRRCAILWGRITRKIYHFERLVSCYIWWMNVKKMSKEYRRHVQKLPIKLWVWLVNI